MHHHIRPLPGHVAAQITSSAAIVSLSAAVLGLFQNALDAQATRLDATVDYARGACTVHDNGLGIPPLEFGDAGALGKLHPPGSSSHNRSFLASLSALSLLSIVSRHHQHGSHSAIMLHHANLVERHVPASSHQHLDGKHGTRVVVRNLFGNLPVRVKQRAKLAAHTEDNRRLWHSFKLAVVGLLLAWARPLSVRVRDADNRVVFAINTSDLQSRIVHGNEASSCKPPSGQLASMLNILTQASFLSVAQWPSWVPISASTSELHIKGAISLEPSPTKNIQFISLGLHPLSSDREHNELYDEVNRLFHLSDFGAAESDAQDGPVNNDSQSKTRSRELGNSNRYTSSRKAVDKYPMFHLRISPRHGLASMAFGPRFIDHETNLQSTIHLLQAMITQWLSTHHFCPRRPRERQVKQPASDSASSVLPKVSTSATSDVSVASTRKRKRTSVVTVANTTGPRQSRAFADWSRIKSGNANFFTVTQSNSKPCSTEHSLSGRALHGQATENGELDDAILWTDPSTRRTHSINARTGFIQPAVAPRSISDTVTSTHSIRKNSVQMPLRLPSRTSTPAKTPWLDTVLDKWDNPVFKLHERPIDQVVLHGSHSIQDSIQSRHERCCHPERTTSGATHSVRGETLTNEDLLAAQVLAQVDRKFILIKVSRLHQVGNPPETSEVLLVLIDQHAADERIQVETLLRELCSPVGANELRYWSKLGHSAEVASVILEKPVRFSISREEGMHFATFAGNFASWGILFDILESDIKPDQHRASHHTSCLLAVTALPPSISERCRTDTGLLVSFLRSAVWDYAGDSVTQARVSFTREQRSTLWVGRLASCPKGLIDMVNSRACRSAIMFNDELHLEECQNLVRKLAGCVFPFVCAHGRPSLVPLADVDSMAHSFQAADILSEAKPGAFVRAWKQWKT
ncbi:hypothetical protein BDU57DRAFT_486555 [Ampelomyces quisqualis]|uniref:MutL C-terminal dimerisation domain-containing protein n=1 Tax=Ampelomyces quisqualis TaxID=50730 RepID=A0A6A5R5M1_AMPQU|nr:hypothetical protein BDU57DRAFT_486555 [Ampelomyces quisqualis]